MLPLPNYEPPSDPIVIDTGAWLLPKMLPRPRSVAMAMWYLWLVVTSLLAIMNEHPRFDDHFNLFIHRVYVGHLLLTPAWFALMIRPRTTHIVSALFVYLGAIFVDVIRSEIVELLLIFVLVAGTWGVLRWCRVIALDLLLPANDDGESRTPRLADHVQFSLRALILMSAVVALGISLYLFFHESSGWSFYQITFFIVVPSEILLFWGMLGRARWYIRLPWLLVATHHWILLPVISHGLVNWGDLYNWDDVPNWIGIPVSQIVSLGILRWAGYRVGLPRPRERALPVAVAVEPQSPWDEN